MKELKYLAALTLPLSALIGINLGGVWSYFTPVYGFVLIPILEIILPLDTRNFDKETKDKRILNTLFDWMLYANLPIVYGLLFYFLWSFSQTTYAPYEIAGLILSIGIVLGTNGINVGHELGHRLKSNDRFLGKLLLLPSLYMHFYIEHNFGHHLHAATKEDPATARYNQSVYSFWITSVSGQLVKSWKIQLKLLDSEKRSFFSIKNDMFWYIILQLAYLILVLILFGLPTLLFAIGAATVGFLLLETVNYIEHYGLLRQKMPSGRYERVKEIHSWNSNHVLGRIMLYELTRHSDHHYISSKKYQVLDCHEDSPQMPFGYPTSMVLSLLPPLWFKIMNKRIPNTMKPA
ncbi:alkane 1-monooxygenase [uncultured Muriicola sp.]|uniref:alkane 1-monooxygenase n=1 Tax=uncultured Muriicola sp. TaxID=1583102 RepID=UPI0026018779|nr:alkane 1-monooxygenase [uncultured Muriicola sp.]